LAEQEPFPWLYPYREDPQQTRLGQPILRPFVQVSLANGGESTTILDGLIDTGADAILASDLLADLLGIDLADHEGEIDEYREWQAQVGFIEDWHSYSFVLHGSVGFLDRFTATASRFAQAVAVEERETFDNRFGVVDAA
jgi:hypothetical protein